MKKTVTITLEESTFLAIRKKAQAEKRTFSAQVDWILSQYVFDNLRKHPKRPTKQEYQERNRQEPEEEVSNEQVDKALSDFYRAK